MSLVLLSIIFINKSERLSFFSFKNSYLYDPFRIFINHFMIMVYVSERFALCEEKNII